MNLINYKYVLEINTSKLSDEYKKYYQDIKCNDEDSGIDLIVPNNYSYDNKTKKVLTIDHNISCRIKLFVNDKFIKYVSYWLLPRSSISKTGFRLANSMGLIDSGYRGNIMAKVDFISDYNLDSNIKEKTRMFQIAVGDLTPISKIITVDDFDDDKTKRGVSGFGSSG